MEVKVWEEAIIIPTYGVGESEKNPMFLEKRVYQGSSGVVYPHAVIEKIEDTKHDQTYQAVFLENQYLKIMILPELGGRIQMAFDKVKQRHFIYYNQVIKPALVGLTGPWISGGIEFNWPQHHRPSTFEPVDFTIESNPDGSQTVWVSEVERMFSTKGMAGFTLYPDKAYLEIKGVLYNRTALPQTFLWWANPAVKVNDHYQSVFPPDVYAVFDHGKRDVSSFPIATGTYYKIDYSPGTDISGYKNIPVPTSYMAIQSKYDFMGGYENDTKGGLLHVANHHISPGKKQWTWGNGEFGYAWDRNLTDEDGPYIELMTGVFTDNQPDFSWIMPNEERRFTQYFMPYSEIGMVKNATKEAAINLLWTASEVQIMAYGTAPYQAVSIIFRKNDQIIFEAKTDLSPEKPFIQSIDWTIDTPETYTLEVISQEGKVLVSYTPDVYQTLELPEPAIAAQAPLAIEHIEQLFLMAQHIEQYRHATYSAMDYYEEALRRDPQDFRCNNAKGLWYYKKGQFAKAKPYFEKAIQTLTARNPNPYDSEPYYNLGLCLKQLNELTPAYNAFFKASWSAAWQDASFLELARIASIQHNYEEALNHATDSLYRNWKGHSARQLKVSLLRILGKKEDALQLISESLAFDQFNMLCYFEKYLLQKDQPEGLESLNQFKKLMRGYVHNYLEYANDYIQAGLYSEAYQLLETYLLELYLSEKDKSKTYPIALYTLAFLADKLHLSAQKAGYLQQAQLASPDKVFPNRLFELNTLLWVSQESTNDGNVFYFLGNFWYAHRQYPEAISAWEKSTSLKPEFPTSYRNLSLAYHNKQNEPEKALKALEKAYFLDPTDARVLMELDQLYKKLNVAPATRLAFLQERQDITLQRNDLYLEYIALHNQTEQFEKAKVLLSTRNFHPWEGGEGKVVGQYLFTHIELAKIAFAQKEFSQALALLEQAETYPVNLGEGKLLGTQENDIHYWKGLIYEALGNNELALSYFQKASSGISELVQAIFYNDPQPDKIFYQGLAWQKLGEIQKAQEIFERLIQFGEKHQYDAIKIDYFAVSLPDLLVFDVDLDERNHIHCQYLQGLGCLGLGKNQEAKQFFDAVLAKNINHQGALIHQKMLIL
jgi:tetratricopeptide (TPR) repeat protein